MLHSCEILYLYVFIVNIPHLNVSSMRVETVLFTAVSPVSGIAPDTELAPDKYLLKD